jgi:ribosomal protein S18 acetylase RimI-like enzyme
MTVSIRKATPADYDGLCRTAEALALLHRTHLPERFQRPEGPVREREYLLGRIADPNVLFLVADDAGLVVGHLQASLIDTPPLPTIRPRLYAYINEIVVQPEYRRQGLGRRFMAEAEAWAVTRGASSIELGTYEFNTEAHEFYFRLGYTTLHRRLNKMLKNDHS